MARFSVVLEGDKTLETYVALAKAADQAGFYSIQFYEHLPYRPAWALAFTLAQHVEKARLGPVTVPANLYDPVVNARFLAYLESVSPGAVLGISRGAYFEKASIKQVVDKVKQTFAELKRLTWASSFSPVVYVGTSGPLLTRAVSAIPELRGIVVDNLANPRYAAEMRRLMDDSGGREKELIARPFTFISTNPVEVDEFFETLKRYVADLVDGSPMLRAAGLNPEDLAEDDEDVRARILESFAVCGSADEVLEKTAALLRSGVSHICFGHPIASNPVEGVKKLAEVVAVLSEQFDR
ncbi:MAG: LLM class flavin-dependent oxidoreductase [Candidatus Caldarchaeum sp.]|nr:LLM class flavin-dependent oxidoreductase [Candidatus Caldarchaeum sp.]MDW7977888.1 LLM class flavin-dependent oxidoreductase [Candidatus Caldarchaeum sp.]